MLTGSARDYSMSGLLQQPWISLHLEPPQRAPGGGRPSVQFGVPLGRSDDGVCDSNPCRTQPFALLTVCATVTARVDDCPAWWDFSVSSLTSFAALEQKIMLGYSHRRRGAPEATAADAAAAVVAAKFAAALGCTDREVEGAAYKAFDISCRVLRWREERGGADEPAAWAAHVAREGHLEQLLSAPRDKHDVESMLPIPSRYHPCHGPQYPYLTIGHVFELLKLDAKYAKVRGCSRSAVMYCWLYPLSTPGVIPELEPPTVKEGTAALVTTPTIKTLYANLERLQVRYKVEREAAQKRATQSLSREATLETRLRAQGEYAACLRALQTEFACHELSQLLPEDSRPEYDLEGAGWDQPYMCGKVDGFFYCGAHAGMCLLCSVHTSEASRVSTVCGRESSCSLDDAREYPDSAGALPLLRDGATLALDVLYNWTEGRAARPAQLRRM